MKSSKLRTLALSLLSLVTVAASAQGGVASAATKPAPVAVNNSANTLRISPVRTDVTVAAGTTAKVPVFVTNLTTTPILLKPIENDFVAGDEKGTPSIILDQNSYAPTHSLKRFLVPLQNVQVAAGETKQVDVSVTVPSSAQAGGYFGAIRFAPVSSDSSKSVNLSASVASLILMNVPGNVTEKLSLTNFDIQQNGGNASNFRTPDDLQLFLRFQNGGNDQLAPFGQINILKGKKVVFTSNFNGGDPKDTILPDSARRWTVPLKGFGKFGKYTVTGTFTYGTKSQSIEIEKTIWIIPTTIIIAGVVGAGVLLVLIIGFILFLKGYKKRVLRKSRGSRRRY